MAQLVLGLCTLNTVNLKKIANIIDGKASSKSQYRRLQRFFRLAEISYDELAHFIVRLFFNEQTSWYLTIDRTNWQYGKSNINILMLAICYKGRAIPLCWKLLNKRGNSNTEERIALIERFIALFGQHRIKMVLADREFIGEKWFSWLNEQRIAFNIRLKNNTLATTSRGLPLEVHGLFYHLKVGQKESLKGKRIIWGQGVYLTGLRLKEGDLLVVATSEPTLDAIEIYAKRWEIETLFECLKSRGFNFEATRLVEPERINKMIAILAIAYCWSHKVGEWRCEQGDGLTIKKHGRLEKSYFRHGLDLLQRIFIGVERGCKTVNSCIQLMRPREWAILSKGEALT